MTLRIFNSVVYRAHSSDVWHRHRPEANLFTSPPTMHFICMRPKNMQKKELETKEYAKERTKLLSSLLSFTRWRGLKKVLLHYGGFCNNCTYRCISKQMHYKTPYSHMKSLEIYENYIILFCLEKKRFCNIILYQNHAWHIPKVIEITINPLVPKRS